MFRSLLTRNIFSAVNKLLLGFTAVQQLVLGTVGRLGQVQVLTLAALACLAEKQTQATEV